MFPSPKFLTLNKEIHSYNFLSVHSALNANEVNFLIELSNEVKNLFYRLFFVWNENHEIGKYRPSFPHRVS